MKLRIGDCNPLWNVGTGDQEWSSQNYLKENKAIL